jgi:serine/threonine protein kinase
VPVLARTRFSDRLAQAVGALSHPNILAIHDFGSDQGVSYAVTELLDGDTLRGRMGGSPLPVRKAVDYGVQIVRGLAAAHQKGTGRRGTRQEPEIARQKRRRSGMSRKSPGLSVQIAPPLAMAHAATARSSSRPLASGTCL